MKGFIKVPTFIFFFIFISMYQYSIVSAAPTENGMDIKTLPDNYTFNITHMVPGDWTSSTLTIQNRGKEDFTYNTEVQFIDGSKKLYNVFSVKVWDSKGILFDGELKEFEGLYPRFLKSTTQEDIMFELRFPNELGNEFQGLGFKFEIRFIVEGRNTNPAPNPDPSNTAGNDNKPILPQRPIPEEELDDPPVDGQILPSTATNLYNNLLIGILLVISGGSLFILQKRKKNLIHDHSRP